MLLFLPCLICVKTRRHREPNTNKVRFLHPAKHRRTSDTYTSVTRLLQLLLLIGVFAKLKAPNFPSHYIVGGGERFKNTSSSK